MQFVEGTVVAGRFGLIRELGHGGMGSVWLAKDTSLDTPCAIKFIHGQAAQDPAMRSRFEREAKSAAQLRSPNVVQILDHGVSDGTPYIAMELLEGEDLDQRLRRMGRLSPQETIFIMSQVGKALGRANTVGLVHRDLKPANIFLVRDEERDIPKVLDFGVAKSSMPDVDSNTKTGALMGTPYYMSPEQTRGTKAVDHRSDLWALAVIVFQCLTGRLPFLSESLGDLLFKIGTDPLPVPSQVAPDLPPGFDAWWARAAQRDPTQRYQTAKEFVDALAMAFGISHGPSFSTGASMPGGALHGSGAASGAGLGTGSGGWGTSQTGATAPGQSGPGAPSMHTGVTASSINDKPESRRGPGVILGAAVAAGIIVGGLVYVLGFRHPGTPPSPAAAVTAGPDPSTAVPHPSAAPPAAPATTVSPAPTPTASASTPPPSESASAPKPIVKPPPGPLVNGHQPSHPNPKQPIVPNDGI